MTPEQYNAILPLLVAGVFIVAGLGLVGLDLLAQIADLLRHDQRKARSPKS